MMRDEVHAIGYRRLEGPRPVWPGWPIARTLWVLGWRRRATKMSLMACFGVFGVHGVWLVSQLMARRYLNLGPRRGLLTGVDRVVGSVHEVLAAYVSIQFFVTALVIAVVASGAIADDRRAGAFELYFSRPLTRLHYALGKLLGAGLIPFGTLVFPTFVLWLTAVGIAPPGMRSELWWLAVPAVGSAALGAATLTAGIIGLSALGERSLTVCTAFVAGLLLMSGVCEGLVESGFEAWGYLSPERDLRTVVDWLLQVGHDSLSASLLPGRPDGNGSPALSLLALGAWIAAGLLALTWRIRREVRAG